MNRFRVVSAIIAAMLAGAVSLAGSASASGLPPAPGKVAPGGRAAPARPAGAVPRLPAGVPSPGPLAAPPLAGSPSLPALDPHQSESVFYSVSCFSATFCMAVGTFMRGEIQQTLTEDWNGKKWRILPSADESNPLGQWLNGVSCPTASFCLAVGQTESGTAVAELWNGTSWTLTTTLPATPVSPELKAVSCPDSTLCAAVGTQNPGTTQALVEYWDAGTWTVGTASNEGTSANLLDSVSCPSTLYCMAGGYYLDSGNVFQPLAEWDMGGTWTINLPTLTDPGAYAYIEGVSCTSQLFCMAVGFTDLYSQERNLSFTWNGTSWTRHATSQPSSAYDDLYAVSCVATGPSSNACLAAGDQSGDADVAASTSVLAWNGAKWSVDPSPAMQPFERLLGISCTSTSRCLAVGESSDNSDEVAMSDSLAGGSWVRDRVPNEVSLDEFLYATSCVSTSFCMAVGDYENGFEDPTFAQAWNGKRWAVLHPKALGDDSELRGVSCVSASLCVAVGWERSGVLFLVPKGSGRRLPEGPHPNAPAGVNGIIEIWSGGKWTETTVGTADTIEESLNAVSCPSSKFCVAVGDDAGEGELESYIWQGKSWQRDLMPSLARYGNSANSVSCTSATNCVAVGTTAEGDRAFAERWNGKSWSVTTLASPPEPNDELSGVDCTSASRCLAVGGEWIVTNHQPDKNLIESWNGKKWSLVSAPTPYPIAGLSAVSCVSSSSCLAAGPNETQLATHGFVLRLASGHWASVTLPSAATGEVNLEGVSQTSPSSAVVAGYKFVGFGFGRFTLVETSGSWAVK